MVSYTSFIQKFYQTLPHKIAALSGATVKVLVPPYWKELWSGGKKMLEKTSDPLYEVVVADARFIGNLHYAYFRGGLRQLLQSFRPDIIDLEDEPFNAGSFQAAWLRERLLPESHLVLRASQDRYKHYPPPFNFFEKYAMKKAAAILVRNSNAQKVLQRKGYRGMLPIITHGVAVDNFRPDDNEPLRRELSPEGRPVVGYVGAFTRQKGLQTLLAAVEALSCRLVLMGDGPEKKALTEIARERNLDIHFLPPAGHEAVAQAMNAMDILVLPSISLPGLTEKFGRVLIEGMASGLAVIGSDSGEIPVVIGDAGLVFREGDAMDLREKITRLLNDKALRVVYGEKGRERAVSTYSWEAIARQTLEVYQQLLKI